MLERLSINNKINENCLMPVTHDIKKAMPEGSQIQSHIKYNIETLVKK